MSDDLEARLRSLKQDPLIPRKNLSDKEKADLIQAIGGPKTARSIRKAMKDLSHDRIPFLFSSLDPQLVIDVMNNDLDQAIEEALRKAKL